MAKEKKSFLGSVVEEMKNVTWPTKKELRKDTLTVIETSLIFAVIFAIMDTAISSFLGLFI